MVKSVVLAIFIFSLFSSVKGELHLLYICIHDRFMSYHTGAYISPIAYMFPDGLQSVNGSSSTGGCEKRCVEMPYSGTAINGCDCPGSNPVSGVLIDGVIPSIDTTLRGTWANELFVVNTNGQDSFMIGFQLNVHDFNLRRVEVTYLDCQVWGTGTSAIEVYSSHAFPGFIQHASSHIGELSLIDDIIQSCISLTTVIIPTQSMDSSNFYIKFSFTGVSSVRPLNWLHLAEIRFSDEEIPSSFTTTTEYIISSTASSEHHTIINNRSIPITPTTDEIMSGSVFF